MCGYQQRAFFLVFWNQNKIIGLGLFDFIALRRKIHLHSPGCCRMHPKQMRHPIRMDFEPNRCRSKTSRCERRAHSEMPKWKRWVFATSSCLWKKTYLCNCFEFVQFWKQIIWGVHNMRRWSIRSNGCHIHQGLKVSESSLLWMCCISNHFLQQISIASNLSPEKVVFGAFAETTSGMELYSKNTTAISSP